MVAEDQERVESLGPAERIIGSITNHVDHLVHNRPGLVVADGRCTGGAKWQQATWVQEGDDKVVYTVQKIGKRQHKTRVGVGRPGTNEVVENGRVVGRFQPSGVFPEIAGYLYEQVAEVWAMDNEFAARWASWAYKNEKNRDLKAVLAAFMLVQCRFGEPIKDGDETFQDDDYRAVGEAMCLLRAKTAGDVFNPKILLRIGQILEVPQVAEINRKLGFGQSQRRSPMGRYLKVLEKWLQNIETNQKVLEVLVSKGFRTSIMQICRKVGYKPQSDRFFYTLRWKQKQAADGRRELAVGKDVAPVDSWAVLTEKQVCEKLIEDKPSWKVAASKIPPGIGVTPAIMSAAIEAGCLSNQDLIIMTPTIEELGLLEDKDVHARWKQAVDEAENQRALNIARNVRTEKAKEGLEEAADKAAAKAVEEVTRDLRIYVIVDRSGSMQGAIEKAVEYISKFVGAIPLDKLHVTAFNTVGKEINISRPTAAAVRQAFRGVNAGGGTNYANGVGSLIGKYRPGPNEDSLFIFIGDEQDWSGADALTRCFHHYGVQPAAFGRLYVSSTGGYGWAARHDSPVLIKNTAAALGIPCFDIDEAIFEDAYAVPRTIRNLIASTPVTRAPSVARRVSLVDEILKTELLVKPAWAA